MVIHADDRVAKVLTLSERLLEVFTDASPHFDRLRNRGTRRVMARLVTVGQAARIAGVEPDVLVARLNSALAEAAEGEPMKTEAATMGAVSMITIPMPAALQALPSDLIVDLDVRQDLREGREPFQRIMAARKGLEPDQVLRLRATFEPVPLYHVLGKQGLEHWTEQLAEDDWRVWFYPASGSPTTSAAEQSPLEADLDDEDEGVVVLDVRGLEPPEPMVRTLAALEQLPTGGTLVQINVRVPQFLLPRLDELGYRYEVREQKDGPVRLFIRRN